MIYNSDFMKFYEELAEINDEVETSEETLPIEDEESSETELTAEIEDILADMFSDDHTDNPPEEIEQALMTEALIRNGYLKEELLDEGKI